MKVAFEDASIDIAYEKATSTINASRNSLEKSQRILQRRFSYVKKEICLALLLSLVLCALHRRIYNTATIVLILIGLLHLSSEDSDYDEGEGLPSNKERKKEQRTIYALLGSNRTIFCGTSRGTAREGLWYFRRNGGGDKLITPTDFPKIKLSNHEIEVRNVTYSDVGFYICKIDNASYMEVKLNVGVPSKATKISVKPLITNDEFSILEIEFGPQIDGYAQYVFEIVGINDKNSSTHEWQPAFNVDSKNCCKIRYTHYGTSIGGLMRLAIENEYGKSEYSESDPFVFPNRPVSPFLRLKVVLEGERKLYLDWEKQCEHDPLFQNYKLRYRTLQFPLNWTTINVPKEKSYREIDVASAADYIFNLVGEGTSQNYYSDQLYYRTKRQSPIVGNFEFTNISSKRLTVKFVPPAEFAGKNFSFKVFVYEGNVSSLKKTILLPSSSNFLINITDLKPNEAYFIEINYETAPTRRFSTVKLYVKTLADIPKAVINLTTRILPPTDGYAVIFVTWDAPKITNGALLGYKIRWKLNKSPDNLFFVEQCDTSYEIKVFYPDEHYSVCLDLQSKWS